MNKLNFYVSEKAFNLIKSLDYPKKDHLYFFCDMIYSMNTYHKKEYDGWTDIPLSYLSSVIKDKNTLSKVKNLLLEKGIIECDNYYSKINKKALGYKYNDEMISKLVKVEVTDKTIFNNVVGNINEKKSTKSSKLRKYKNHFLKTFKLDTEAVYKEIDTWYENEHYKLMFNKRMDPTPSSPLFMDLFLGDSEGLMGKTGNINNINNNNYTNVVETYSKATTTKGSRMTRRDPFIELLDKYNHLISPIKMIEEGRIYFNRNKTNNRVDTNLTTLKSDYKKYIISDDTLYSIDIKNSQPYLLSLLLVKENDGTIDNTELKIFIEYTRNGEIYEIYQTYLYKKTNILHQRKDIKNIIFKILFSKEKHYGNLKNDFRKLFPTIMKYIDKRTKKDHSSFSISLQKLESDIMIDDICSSLDDMDIKYYTIHDSIICSEDKVEMALNIIKDSFNKKFSSIPTFKVDQINHL